MPEPFSLVVKYRLKIRSRISGGIPGPNRRSQLAVAAVPHRPQPSRFRLPCIASRPLLTTFRIACLQQIGIAVRLQTRLASRIDRTCLAAASGDHQIDHLLTKLAEVQRLGFQSRPVG